MTTETRTTSSTGGQKGVKPQRMSLLPREALEKIAEVYAFGEVKYAAHNWRKGYEWSKSYDALQRHLGAFWGGETNDPETGLPHLAHAGFHVFAMLTWLQEQGEGGQFDDRYRPEPVKEELPRVTMRPLDQPDFGWGEVPTVEFDEAHEWPGSDLQPFVELHNRAIRQMVNAQFRPQFSIDSAGTITGLFKDPMAEAREYLEAQSDYLAELLEKVAEETPSADFPRVTIDQWVHVKPVDQDDFPEFDERPSQRIARMLVEAAEQDLGRRRG